MFVQWDNLTDILTHYSTNNSFMETFKHTVNSEKISLCMQNDFIRYFLTDILNQFSLYLY